LVFVHDFFIYGLKATVKMGNTVWFI
jgi:hypothetical protein